VLFSGALLVGGAAIVDAWIRGAREGGAPLVMLTLLLAAVVTLDAIGRGAVAVVRRLVSDDDRVRVGRRFGERPRRR
jgi:hypothetical protein